MIITEVTKKLLILGVLLLPGLALATNNFSPADIYDDEFPLFPDNDLPVQVEDRFPPVIYERGHVLDNTVPWMTGVATFDPTHTYTAEEKKAIIDDEQALTGAERTTTRRPPGMPEMPGMDEDETYQLEIDQALPTDSDNPASLPLENFNPAALVAPGQLGRGNFTPANQLLNQSFTPAEQRFGDSVFGAGYTISTSITSKQLSNGKEFNAQAELSLYATVFSVRQTIFKATAKAFSDPYNNNCAATLYVMGSNVWNRSASTKLEDGRTPWSRNFFRAERRFMVGPVPIKVTASIVGEVGINVSASAGNAGVALNATPNAVARASISAGVDAVVAAAGFGGDLTLIDISTPYNHKINFSNNALSWQFTVDRRINTIAGRVYLYAVVKFIFFKKRWELDIAKWDGKTWTYNLVNLRYPSSRAGVPSASVSLPVP